MSAPPQQSHPTSKGEHHASAELEFELPPAAKPTAGKLVILGVVVVAALVGAFFFGFLPRYHAKKELRSEEKTSEGAILRVQVISPKTKPSDGAMTLPGSVQALEEAVLYPRSSGYVRTWKADIGDTVKEGALLAEIDTPEIDQQLAQARAQLAQAESALVQAKANQLYSQTTLKRFQELTPKGVSSEQELDKAKAQAIVDESSVGVASANVTAQKANLQRIAEMQGFSRVTAPFAGTVNMRAIERGSLVSPTTALFKLSQSDIVRVYVQVPQDVAPTVQVGAAAHFKVREYGDRTFEGKVARTAGSLDPSSRTMNTEVRIPNDKHELLAGMYGQLSMTLPRPHRVFEVPATAVITDAKGIRVAVVEDGKLRLSAVTIERDNGATMELASGLRENDKIVRIGDAQLYDGRPVEIAQ